MHIQQNIQLVRQSIPADVRLVCVSKYHTIETVQEAYNCGERVFGESRAQELQVKVQALPKDIEWHFIGHLQTNKVKLVCQYASLIQSVDSLRLFNAIEKTAKEINTIVDILLEVHVAQEDTKTGLTPTELFELLEVIKQQPSPHIRIKGLMGMATNTDDENQIRQEFRQLKIIFDQVKSTYFPTNEHFDTLSMGMSDDYTIAIEEGSTMVRIGGKIFS